MKYEITGNWKNGFKNDAVLFFSQSIEKLLNPNTDHVHCVSVLNAYSLLYEYLEAFDLVRKGMIDKKHLDFISDEIWETLGQDVIVNCILKKTEILAIKQKFSAVPFEEKKSVILYLVNQLYKFNEIAKNYLLENIKKEKNKTELYLGLKSYLPYLIGGGYSEDFIYNYNKKIFKSGKEISINTVETFLTKFDFVNQRFTVILPVDLEIKQFQAILEKRLSVSFNTPSKFIEGFHYDTDRYILISASVEELDSNQASIRVMNNLALFTRYYKFFSQSTKPFFGKSCIVIDDESGERNFIKIRRNGLVYLSEEAEISKLQIGETAEGVITSLMTYENNVFPVIDKAIMNYTNAYENKHLESSFLNFWAVLESLCEKKDISKIMQIEDNILPILSKDYYAMIFEALLRDVTDNIPKNQLEGFFNTYFNKSSINNLDFINLILLDEYKDARIELNSFLEKYPFIRYNIFAINKRYEKLNSVKKDIERFETRLKWHLRRLYRARNTIIHSREIPKHLQYLTKHLMEYTSQVLIEILFNLTIREDINNVESLFIDVELFNSTIKTYLSKESKKNITREDIAFLVSHEEKMNAN